MSKDAEGRKVLQAGADLLKMNGEEIGTSGRAFSRPAEFDLTAAIDQEGDNLLAIEIVRKP